jgi:hypothetical protein
MTIALNTLASHYRFRKHDTLVDKVKAVCWRHNEQFQTGDPCDGNSLVVGDRVRGKQKLRWEDHSIIMTAEQACPVIDGRAKISESDVELQKRIGSWLLGTHWEDISDFEDHKRLSNLDPPTAVGYFLTGFFASKGKVEDLAAILEAIFSPDRGYRRTLWAEDSEDIYSDDPNVEIEIENNQRNKIINGMAQYFFDHANPGNNTLNEVITKTVNGLFPKLSRKEEGVKHNDNSS